ncbi:MAG: TrkA family potassium uptake protein [Oscillospiraceae bacterium]
MNIIIVGCGRLGSNLANELSDAGHNISIIDRDNERLNVLGSGFNGLKIKGIEYDNEVLAEAEIQNADVIISVTPDENVNITVSLIAKKIYRVPSIIARIVNPNRKYIYENLDIETINPTQLGVDILKSKIARENSQTIANINKYYEVAEITVNKKKSVTVKEIEEKYNCIISGIKRNEDFILPEKSYFINQGDEIVCTLSTKDKERLISQVEGELYK